MGRRTWTDQSLRAAVKTSRSYAEVIQKLGLSLRPGNYPTVKKYIEKLSLDTSHFVGLAHGNTVPTNKVPLNKILVKNSRFSRGALKRRLIREKLLDDHCAICGLKSIWQEKPLVLVLDHINGINNDNRLNNLRVICPNCNSQTDTFTSRGLKKEKAHKCKSCGSPIRLRKTGLCYRCVNSTYPKQT